MNEEIKALWLAALRSGDYKQGKHVLRAGDKFCCLGVLCDLAFKAGRVETRQLDDVVNEDGEPVTTGYVDTNGMIRSGVLPQSVVDWAGLNDSNPAVVVDPESGYKSRLSSLNDAGRPFTKIADYIEGSL